MNELEQMLADKLADGQITDDDAEQVRLFADFLKIAGAPGAGNVAQRLHDAGRDDLLAWVRGES